MSWLRVGVMAVALVCLPRSAVAQNPASATEATQAMNFLQLVQMATTAESQLRSVQMMVEFQRTNMERLSRGDIQAIRGTVSQAMMVQTMVAGYLAARRSNSQTLESAYPSPAKLDGRFQTWAHLREHQIQVERDTHEAFEVAATVLDKQLSEGLREDGRLLQKLRDSAGNANSEAKHLQVTNQILLELVRQLHLLRTEAMSAHRMDVMVAASDQQRRTAQASAEKSINKPARVGSSSEYQSYTLSGRPVGLPVSGGKQ